VGDVVRYTEGGREYSVYGLATKAAAIRGGARALAGYVAERKAAADTALVEWRGRHTATFAEQHNDSISYLSAVHQALDFAAATCESFPTRFASNRYLSDTWSARAVAAHVDGHDTAATASAVPAELQAYASTVEGSRGLVGGHAAKVSYSELRAEVRYDRALTPSERQDRLDSGADPASVDDARVGVTAPQPVQELITLTPPTDQAARASALAVVVAEFTTAVAGAFERSDQAQLDLLADHPELADFLVSGEGSDLLAGDTALAVLLAHFDALDVADEGGDPDGKVSTDDLEAAAADESLPAEVRAAAQYLLDNPTLRMLVDTGDDGSGPLAEDGTIKAADLEAFLATNAHLRVVQDNLGVLDTADDGGDRDGYVSRDDLEAAADDASLSDDVRAAARYLLDHDAAFTALAGHEEEYFFGPGGFTANDLIGRLVDGQAYAHDPAAAERFVNDLPVATDGDEGLPITLTSDDGVRALARAGLASAGDDLTDMQSVIAHLPETEGAVRNQLITAFYDVLAVRSDGVFAGSAGLTPGDPSAPGHPGANWLVFAPWASNGVRNVIDGSFSVWGINPSGRARQGAADGNQWIFNDITARFADFVELYESTGSQPSTEQLEDFFDDTFADGDLEIRRGFEAYVAAINEPDPARRQQLMFQANTLVATHEQAGAQPYLEDVTAYAPDGLATRYIDLDMGGHHIEVDPDLDVPTSPGNLVVGAPILDLDPSTLGEPDLSGNGVTFAGPGADPAAVNLDPISGWDDFDTSTRSWYEDHGDSTDDPDSSMEGTGTGAWTTYGDRMWFLTRMFEQLHTDPSLYDTSSIQDGLDLDWLDPALRERLGG